MTLTKSPAGRSLKWFASASGSFAGALLFLSLLEAIAFLWKEGNVIKDFFGAIYVVVMFVICIGTLLFQIITSIFTYINTCKEKQKKFLLFALPAQVVAIALMFVSIALLFPALKNNDHDGKVAGCILNLVAGLITLYICIVSTVFKHVV
ncbi:MAG: hypothetical protein MJ195_01735 [Mycoplasmoidaceae bacterium]|nr:hypothetical protein [Mycoplasmoidaceae bacterium]